MSDRAFRVAVVALLALILAQQSGGLAWLRGLYEDATAAAKHVGQTEEMPVRGSGGGLLDAYSSDLEAAAVAKSWPAPPSSPQR